jgi:NAD(P)-dependent dehydrogenase (short-subunit alcohol dehydrogenase family)
VTFIGSVSGMMPCPYVAAYSIVKRAILQVAANYAEEWAPFGIRVNTVAPGATRTRISASIWTDESALADYVSHIPLRKMGEPEEIAAACLLLASPAGRSMTGQTLVIDNGASLPRSRMPNAANLRIS